MATKSTMFSRYNLVIRRGQTYSEVSETIRSTPSHGTSKALSGPIRKQWKPDFQTTRQCSPLCVLHPHNFPIRRSLEGAMKGQERSPRRTRFPPRSPRRWVKNWVDSGRGSRKRGETMSKQSLGFPPKPVSWWYLPDQLKGRLPRVDSARPFLNPSVADDLKDRASADRRDSTYPSSPPPSSFGPSPFAPSPSTRRDSTTSAVSRARPLSTCRR